MKQFLTAAAYVLHRKDAVRADLCNSHGVIEDGHGFEIRKEEAEKLRNKKNGCMLKIKKKESRRLSL